MTSIRKKIKKNTPSGPVSGLNFKSNDSIVALIDVLGFKEMVVKNKAALVQRYFNKVIDTQNGLQQLKGPRLKMALLSDSIILSYDLKQSRNDALFQMISACAKVQRILLTEKILTRGSISFGSFYMNTNYNVLVGSGLVRSYLSERQAKYPRIIIDPELISQFEFKNYSDLASTMNQRGNLISDIEFSTERTPTSRLEKRLLFVDYLAYYDPYFELNTNKIETFLSNEIKKTKSEYYEKIEWLSHYFVQSFPNNSKKLRTLRNTKL
ncbi:hypothetical protein [Bdellovibrio bacteriovorus]|uniref:hypothetical protein n=1 Tax=Bdellovibrio bacteriovorus TaxID=959 RepID=UPI003AA9A5C7